MAEQPLLCQPAAGFEAAVESGKVLAAQAATEFAGHQDVVADRGATAQEGVAARP